MPSRDGTPKLNARFSFPMETVTVKTNQEEKGEERLQYRTSDGVDLVGLYRHNLKDSPVGGAILAHGLNNDKDEDGSFTKLSVILAREGYNVLRFDFRGHGESKWETQRVTISGELTDFTRTVEEFDNHVGREDKLLIVASSFGASSSILYTQKHENRVKRLVLWNPVLDYEKTFLKAETPWGRTYFNPRGYKTLKRLGYVTIPTTDFRIGQPMVDEFYTIRPYQILSRFKIPVLTIHGTEDRSVPYSVSAKFGVPNKKSEFIAHKCDHQFFGLEDIVIAETVHWITSE